MQWNRLLLTTGDIRQLLRLSEAELDELIRRGFPGILLNEKLRFPLIDVVLWLSLTAQKFGEEVRSKGIRLDPVPEPLVTANQIANELGVERRTISTYLKKGIPVTRTPGGHLRFSPLKVRAWLEEQNKPTGERQVSSIGSESASASMSAVFVLNTGIRV